MSSLVPESWRGALEKVHDKIGGLLSDLVPSRREVSSPERMTADTIPAFMQFGGPPIDLHETRDELMVRAEVPGLKKEDIKIELVAGRLSIRGEKKLVRVQKKEGTYLSESRYGSFARSIQLPCEVDEKNLKADLKDGILSIRLRKSEKERARSHRIPVS